MADSAKVLGQAAPTTSALTDLYTVPSAKSAVVSSVVVCNRFATPSKFRLSVAVAGAADADGQYIYYDCPILGNDTFVATVGITMGATDVLRCYSSPAQLSYNAFGSEIT